MAVTISDIAKHVGVTKATVSKVLNKSSSNYTISEKTKQKIYNVIKELNYRPNYLSRALVGCKSMTVGLVINPVMFSTPIHAERISIIEKTAQKSGYFIYIVGKPYQNEIEPIQGLLDRRVDGLIVYFATEPSKEIVDFLSKQTIPIVYMDWAPPGCTRCVKINRKMGICQIVEHLVQFGHRNVQYIPSAYDLKHPGGKLSHYQEAFASHGIDLKVDSHLSISYDEVIKREIPQIINQLIAEKKLPSALIMPNDYAAQTAIASLQDAGVRVPEQISVVGFDNLNFADVVRPALTTVRQPIERASKAFELLESLMKDSEVGVEMLNLPCEMVVRQSTGPAPV